MKEIKQSDVIKNERKEHLESAKVTRRNKANGNQGKRTSNREQHLQKPLNVKAFLMIKDQRGIPVAVY